MNKLRIIILVVYTALLTAIVGILLATSSSSKNRFVGYTQTPGDENIQLNLEMLENRSSSKVTDTAHEKSYYDMYVYLSKYDSNAMITNIRVYVGIETEENEFRYVENSSNPKKLESTYVTTVSVPFLNSSSSFCVHQFKNDSATSTEVETNQVPKKIYVRVLYNISSEKNEKEIKYLCNTSKIESFSTQEKYVQKDYTSGMMTNTGEVFDYSLAFGEKDLSVGSYSDKTTPGKYIDLTKFMINAKNLDSVDIKENGEELDNTKKIVNCNLEIFGKCSKLDSTNTEKKFSEYIRLFSYFGYVPTTSGTVISSKRNAYDVSYNIEKLFVKASVTLANKKTVTYTYQINISK